MKAISIYVSEEGYEEFQKLSESQDRPVAELIREAMARYLKAEEGEASIIDIPPCSAGRLKKKWKRAELLDEMIGK